MQAQLTGGTAPGGFVTTSPTSDITLWLRGDAGITKDGASRVSAWADQSGHGNNVVQGSLTFQPTQTLAMNGVPVVSFSGGASTQAFMATGSPVSAQSIFVVTTARGQSDCCNPVIGDSATFISTRYDIGNFWRNPGDGNDFTNPGGSEMRLNGAVAGTNPVVAPNVNHFLSLERGSGAHNFTTFQLARHNAFPTRSYNGDIGEVIAFNRLLNQAEETIIDNYISSKFDIALNTAGGALDRYAGDTLANGNRDFGVFGIGQASDGSNVTNAGADGFGIQATSGLTNGEFIMAGHDGTANAPVPQADGIGTQWSREWYVDFNATDAILDFAFDFSDAGLPAPEFSYFELLMSTDGITFEAIRTDGVLDGDRVVFSNFDSAGVPNGLFTLGISPVPESATIAGWVVCGLATCLCFARRSRKP